jgi:peptidoglycan/LPS O-acetylase OafA/YrhL
MSKAQPAPNRNYIAALTGLRGMAALFVFLYHYAALHPGIRMDLLIPFFGVVLQFPLGLGFVGVDLFFVLSGFLLTLPFAGAALGMNQKPAVAGYLKRRFLRVIPAYYTQLFIILLVGSWFVTWRAQTPISMVAQLTMFFNIGWAPVTPIVGVWWTLPVEMGFYLLLPLLAPFMRPSRWLWALLAGLTITVVYRAWAAAHFGPISTTASFLAASQLPGNLAEFMFGSTAAVIIQSVSFKNISKPPAWMLDLMVVIGLVLPAIWLWQVVLAAGAVYWLGHWSMLISPLVIGLCLAVAVLGVYWGSRIGKALFANRLMYFLGLISYSLYLWHFVVMQQIQVLVGEPYATLTHWVQFPLSVVSVVLTATISYFAIERPFYRLK